MPQDSIVYFNGTDSLVIYPGAERTPAELAQMKNRETTFQKEKLFYDRLGDQITVFETLIIAAVLFLLGRKQYYQNKHTDRAADQAKPFASYDGRGRRVITKQAAKLVYRGADLHLTSAAVTAILEKRFPYFNRLTRGEQQRFLLRHKKFMRDKIFNIHDSHGFKEMPVLISAAAIQLTFGLSEFMMPFYQYINIFPQEFMRTDPMICFLKGNVSGNNIKISWKHFLEGYEFPDNGDNVGLHEMAHAYYCQNFVCDDDGDACFAANFPAFNEIGVRAYEREQRVGSDVYSAYALRNFQEFWAESVELFFERPAALRNKYPALYSCLEKLLNQSPLAD